MPYIITPIDELPGDKRNPKVAKRITVAFRPTELQAIKETINGQEVDFKHYIRCAVLQALLVEGALKDGDIPATHADYIEDKQSAMCVLAWIDTPEQQ